MLVPGARVELAWISPNDFEFFKSKHETIKA